MGHSAVTSCNTSQLPANNRKTLGPDRPVMLHLLFFLSATVLAQDTYTCPDGWHISDIGVECILLSGVDERVTKADAAIICEFHGGWLVDMDEGRGPQKNNLIKSFIGEADPGSPGFPGNQYGDQWWIG